MENIEITMQTILAVCGGISIIGGAGAMVHKWLAPALKLTDRVSKLEGIADRDYKALTDLKEKQDLIMETLSVLTYNRLADKIEYLLTKEFATPEERRELKLLDEVYVKQGWNGDMTARMEQVYALPHEKPAARKEQVK